MPNLGYRMSTLYKDFTFDDNDRIDRRTYMDGVPDTLSCGYFRGINKNGNKVKAYCYDGGYIKMYSDYKIGDCNFRMNIRFTSWYQQLLGGQLIYIGLKETAIYDINTQIWYSANITNNSTAFMREIYEECYIYNVTPINENSRYIYIYLKSMIMEFKIIYLGPNMKI